jgi:small subunit ribosomal protein S20
VANSPSAKKRAKQGEARRIRNRSNRTVVKTQIRKFLDAIHEKDLDLAQKEFHLASKMLDQKAAKGAYHRNTAARKKSRLAARLNALVSAGG